MSQVPSRNSDLGIVWFCRQADCRPRVVQGASLVKCGALKPESAETSAKLSAEASGASVVRRTKSGRPSTTKFSRQHTLSWRSDSTEDRVFNAGQQHSIRPARSAVPALVLFCLLLSLFVLHAVVTRHSAGRSSSNVRRDVLCTILTIVQVIWCLCRSA